MPELTYNLGYLPSVLDFLWQGYEGRTPFVFNSGVAGPGRLFCTVCGDQRRMKVSVLEPPLRSPSALAASAGWTAISQPQPC